MNENYPIIVKSYTLTLWYIQKIEKLPKNHRYTLGERIQTSLLALLMTLSDTIYSRDKKSLLLIANQEIERLRLLTKLIKDLSLLSSDNYQFILSSLNEIGQMIGGWKKTLS
jgi:four helix bundle protein